MNKPARFLVMLVPLMWLTSPGVGADNSFNGLDMNLGNLSRTSKAKTRSISPENFNGEKGKAGMSTDGAAKGAARDLGQGWKVSPFVRVPAKSTLAPGLSQPLWRRRRSTYRPCL